MCEIFQRCLGGEEGSCRKHLTYGHTEPDDQTQLSDVQSEKKTSFQYLTGSNTHMRLIRNRNEDVCIGLLILKEI